MIGPAIPAHLLKSQSSDDEHDDVGPQPGPSSPRSTTPPSPAGPPLPQHLLKRAPPDPEKHDPPSVAGPAIPAHLLKPAPPPEDDDDDDDAFLPALPPDLSASKPAPAPARQLGPARPPPEEDSDDDYGPMPLPAGAITHDETDGVREFIERERRRQQNIEEAAKPKALKRDDWMLAPPSSSELFASVDPTKLKNRQFSRSTQDKPTTASNLWTETPAERQQRLADEVSGKRKRLENSSSSTTDDVDAAKRRKRDEELRAQVEAHNRSTRGKTLVDMHTPAQKDPEEGPPGIWDHSRDMALSGRLMDEGSRQKMLQDARGLGDRFGHGRSGGFL